MHTCIAASMPKDIKTLAHSMVKLMIIVLSSKSTQWAWSPGLDIYFPEDMDHMDQQTGFR